MAAKRLGQLLLELGWISDRDLVRALHTQEVLGGRLGTCLLEVDAITEQLLNQALQLQLGVEAIRPLDLYNIPQQIYNILPAKVAVRCQAIPYRLLGKDLWVALLDVHNLGLLDEIAFATGKTVRARVANEHRIELALEEYYARNTTARFKQLYQRIHDEDPTAMILRGTARDSRSAAETLEIVEGEGGIVGVRRSTIVGISEDGDIHLQDTDVHQAMSATALLDSPTTNESPEYEIPLSERAAESSLVDPSLAESSIAESSSRAVLRDPDGVETEPSPVDNFDLELGEALDRLGPSKQQESRGGKVEPSATQPIEWIAVAPEPRGKTIAAALLGEPASSNSTEEVIGRLHEAESRDEIAHQVIEHISNGFERVALLSVRGAQLRGWMGAGPDFNPALLSSFVTSWNEPSVFLNLRDAGAFFAGALAPMATHQRLMDCWSAGLPSEAVVVPIRIGERLVAYLFCDPAGNGLERSHIEELTYLASSTSSALRNLIMRLKQAAH